jgi:hypothetical protein
MFVKMLTYWFDIKFRVLMVLSKLLIFTKIFIEKIIEFIRFFKVCLRQYYIFIIREDNNKKDNSQKNIKYLRCGLLLPNLIYMKYEDNSTP